MKEKSALVQRFYPLSLGVAADKPYTDQFVDVVFSMCATRQPGTGQR